MRLLLDTCVIIDWLTDPHSIGDEVWDVITFYRNQGLELIEY